MKTDNVLNSFGFCFYNGILIGFEFIKSPEQNEFVLNIPFMRFAWIKEFITDEEVDNFINGN